MDHEQIVAIANVLYNRNTLTVAFDLSRDALAMLADHTADVGCEMTRLLEEELNNILSVEDGVGNLIRSYDK